MLNFSKVVFFNIIVDTKHMFYLDYCKLKLKDMKDIYSSFGRSLYPILLCSWQDIYQVYYKNFF